LLAGRFGLAPEQRSGDPATTRSDVWAFGALVYELLTGRPPIPSSPDGLPDPPSAFTGGLGGAADEAVLRALASQPDARPVAAGIVLRDVFSAAIANAPRRRQLLLHHRREAPAARMPEPMTATAILDPAPPVARTVQRLGAPTRAKVKSARAAAVTFAESAIEWARAKPFEAALAGVAVLLLGFGTARFFAPGPSVASGPPMSTLSTTSPAGSWTMAGQNPARTGFAPEAGAILEGRSLWQQSLGAAVTSPPVAAGSLVIVGLADGRVSARDVATGQLKWEYKATGSIEAGPAVADGLTFVGLKDGRVVALDTASGGMRWEHRTGGPISAAPFAVDGVLYVGSNDGSLSALDAAGGMLRWRYDAGAAIVAPPAFANGLVVVGTTEGRLHLLDGQTGSARWVYRPGGGIEAAPLLAGGFAYVATDRGIVQAVDPFAKGAPFEWELRQLQALAYQWGLPVGLPGPQPGYKWSANVATPVQADLATAGTLLFVAGTDGKITSLDALDGKPRWSFQFNGPATAPIVAGDLVYAASEDKRLVVLGAATGDKLMEITLTGKIRVAPALSRGQLFVATEEGKLYAIK
jgi:outer membrane protein assembly factor BamB